MPCFQAMHFCLLLAAEHDAWHQDSWQGQGVKGHEAIMNLVPKGQATDLLAIPACWTCW